MSGDLDAYLSTFVERARRAGLEVKQPGKNWVPLPPIAPGCHVSLSVARHQVQVNLNNERDEDRTIIDRLEPDRDAIEREIGEGLIWEQKGGRKKTAVRAALERGFDDGDWEAQHGWAIEIIRRFEAAFGARLGQGS